MKEASNGKEIRVQLNLFTEAKATAIEDSWFLYPYGGCNLDDAVLRSFAGCVPSGSCTPRQASRISQLRVGR